MSVANRKELLEHLGHDVEVASYNDGESVTVECLTCNEVLYEESEEID